MTRISVEKILQIKVKDVLIRSEKTRERKILHQVLTREKEKGRHMLMLQSRI